jgi:hypothetical protein
MVSRIPAALAAALVLTISGCGGAVREQRIEIRAANDPLFEPRSILARYADGQPLGSEVESFPAMVQHVRSVDPQRADLLEQGLQELLQAAPGARAAKAKQLLEQLQPSPG